jgi:hypothetical protein
VVKKKAAAAAASMSSMESFRTVGLALELEAPTTAVANIPGQKVGGVLELWPGWPTRGGGGQYPPKGGGGRYPTGGGGGSHIRGCLTVGDPPDGIMGGGPL